MYSAPAFPAASRPLFRLPPQDHFNSLEEFKGQVFWKAMDPYFYGFLNQKLEGGKPEDIQLIFAEVKDQVCILMFDRFGTTVILKLFQVCNEQQVDQLVSSVTADVHLLMLVCLDERGSMAVCGILQCLRTPKQISDMISVLQRLTARLVYDCIGFQVISRCFDIFPAKQTQPILDLIADLFFDMATNGNGFILLLKLIQCKAFLLESHPSILSKLIADVSQLSRHPIGCSMVDYVIHIRMHNVVREIVAQLTGDFALLSMNKYGICVVYSLMKGYKETYAPQIIYEIIHSPNFSRVLRDPYGKSIIKYAQKYSTKTVKETLKRQIFDHLHSHRHGKNVLPKKKR